MNQPAPAKMRNLSGNGMLNLIERVARYMEAEGLELDDCVAPVAVETFAFTAIKGESVGPKVDMQWFRFEETP